MNVTASTPEATPDEDKNPSPYLTVVQAANRLQLKPDTLDKWRQQGRGPMFREHGRRIVYHIDDLDRWSDDQIRQRARQYSTSSGGQGGTQ